MHRKDLLDKLERYNPSEDEKDIFDKQRVIDFVRSNGNCFERGNLAGHITGSAWIESYDGSCFLLTLHRKLKKWFQVGGHADGDCDILNVAMREAHEESGLKFLEPLSTEIFDVDAHVYPGDAKCGSHIHYDIRFLLRASDPCEKIKISQESIDLKWFNQIPTESYTVLGRLERKWNLYHKLNGEKTGTFE